MTAEQVTTIVTNILTSGGAVTFFYFVIRSLKREISGLNKTIEQQNKTLEVMEKRVVETEKVGNIYRNLIADLPEQVSKYKSFINEMKDDVIKQLEDAQDETVKESRKVELQRLELQEKMLSELPRLREELVNAVEGIQERVDAMNPGWIQLGPGVSLRPKGAGLRVTNLRTLSRDANLQSRRGALSDFLLPDTRITAKETEPTTEDESED
jgi:hypothetical protein